jgi:hypothetical protein
MSLISSGQSISLPDLFRWDEVSSLTTFKPATTTTPPLGPLASFTGTFTGNGFNTIFRPNSPFTPTPLPLPPIGPDDNVLELNLTQEALTFSAPLGSIPNRGFVQGDIFLNGVPYIQSIQDVTVPTQPVGIHFEPGVWLAVPETTNPAETNTFVRMASIPHGTTVLAQGTSVTVNGPPNIAPVDITPFVIGQPGNRIAFPSQTAATDNTFRIPQNLAPFVAAGTITQAMLTDPNTFLRNHIVGQNITSTTVIQVFTPAQRRGPEHGSHVLDRDGRALHHRSSLRCRAPALDLACRRGGSGRARYSVYRRPTQRQPRPPAAHGHLHSDPVLPTGAAQFQWP